MKRDSEHAGSECDQRHDEDAPHPARNQFHWHPQAKFDEVQASIKASRDDFKASRDDLRNEFHASMKELRGDLRSDFNAIKAVGQCTELMLGRMSFLERALGVFASIIAIVALVPPLLGIFYSATGVGLLVVAVMASLQRDPGAAFLLSALALFLVAAAVAIVRAAISAIPGWPAQPPQPPQQPPAAMSP